MEDGLSYILKLLIGASPHLGWSALRSIVLPLLIVVLLVTLILRMNTSEGGKEINFQIFNLTEHYSLSSNSQQLTRLICTCLTRLRYQTVFKKQNSADFGVIAVSASSLS
jgi:hypothetical protein